MRNSGTLSGSRAKRGALGPVGFAVIAWLGAGLHACATGQEPDPRGNLSAGGARDAATGSGGTTVGPTRGSGGAPDGFPGAGGATGDSGETGAGAGSGAAEGSAGSGHGAPGDLIFSSSSPELEKAFAWAKATALSYVKTGRDHNIPSYQAAIQDRPVFCIRDYAHQVDGAALLGLHDENFAMLKAFASLQTVGRRWYTVWEVNYDGTISPIDYKSDEEFWRILSGMFELVEKAYRQYEWTGDTRLISDSDLSAFYLHTLTDFVEVHDDNANGVAEEHSNDGWQGAPSYNEKGGIVLAESGDALGCQYKATAAYGKLLSAKGDDQAASTWTAKAAELKALFNATWYSNTDQLYVSGFLDKTYQPVTDFGYEGSWFIPLKELPEAGPRATGFLDFVYDSFNARPSTNIEAWSYLPDVFYLWNQNERAWSYLEHIMASRSDYPEISFVVVSALATGMMGIEPDARLDRVATLPRLPSDVATVNLQNIPVGSHILEVGHQGNVATTLAHHDSSSYKPLTWEARFAGTHAQLIVNGVRRDAASKSLNGTALSVVEVTLLPGERATVTTGESPPVQPATIANPGFESGTDGWTFSAGTGASVGFSHEGTSRAWLDPGTSHRVSQTLTVPGSAADSMSYRVSAWLAAAGPSGVFGVNVNGMPSKSAPIENQSVYVHIELTGIAVKGGDVLELYVSGPSSGWANADDFSITLESVP